VILFLALSVVGATNYITPSQAKIEELHGVIQSKEQEIAWFLETKGKYEKDKDLIALIESNEEKIVSCVNQRIACTEIPQTIRENFGFARSYLQLNNLHDPKMEINEKIILANINEYLIRRLNKETVGSSNRVWTIGSISIGAPSVVANNLYSIPIRLQASFENKDDLLLFIENVDKNVLDKKQFRILYKIDEIGYNIMQYEQQQTVSIQLHAFYYQG
jgi:hypothetical protein